MDKIAYNFPSVVTTSELFSASI